MNHPPRSRHSTGGPATFFVSIMVLIALLLGLAPLALPADATVAPVAGLLTASTKAIEAKALTDHTCDTSEWHFVITQLADPDDAPASIQVFWANGNSQTVLLDTVTGGTAHYRTTANLNSTVTQATAQIYSEWSGQFNLSHGPCGTTPTPTRTRTAVPPTATPTQTTVPPTSTPTQTTEPPTATPTQTTVPPTSTPTQTTVPPTVTPTETAVPPTATPTQTTVPPTATPTETAVPPTATPTQTNVVLPLPAACTYITANNRNPRQGEMITITGQAINGGGPNALVAYRFTLGDGHDTGWINVASWPGSVSIQHTYNAPGNYQVRFYVKQLNGQILGGPNSRCGFMAQVRPPTPTPPPTIVVPTPVCGVQPPLFIVGVVEDGQRLQVAGLSWDNALVEVQIQGVNDADFLTVGTTTADAFGFWTYTTAPLTEVAQYKIRARSGGVLSDNTVLYTLGNGPSSLRLSTLRVGLSGTDGHDTSISQSAPTIGHSTSPTLSVRTEDVTNPLLHFDLSHIPANARIVMARLGLYSLDAEPCTNMVAASYQVLRTWDYVNATWISATQSITWQESGANAFGVDRLVQPTYTETVKAPFTWYGWDITDMVQNWVANPSANFGLIIKSWSYGREVNHTENNLDQPLVILHEQPLADGIGGRRDFAASEYPELHRRPVLYVTYVIP